MENAESSEQARAVIYLRVSTKDQATKGGEAEGYSIPAQRQACQRKAETFGAVVTEEFVDAGESARSAHRPQLQAMLDYVAEEHPDYVIVHKIDRLARNRFDDLEINLAFKNAGATLVSCSENIDETPSGKLLHAIMSGMAEFYSSNLATEVIKGSVQKAKAGGTLGKAPVGYKNVRRIENGREIRTVEIDEDRMPLVRWAFEQYASGEWSLTRLTEALAARGLTSRHTTHRTEKALTRASVHRMLRNRYYAGVVAWRGVEYEGAHETFIDRKTFDQVQAVLEAHNVAGEKERVHHHYLKGSVWCETCGSRLCFMRTVNRHGSEYSYFFCLGRQQKRTECGQGFIPAELVEQHIEEKWRNVKIHPDYAALLHELIEREIAKQRAEADQNKAVATAQISKLREERRKLLEAHYAGAVPLDLLKSEQERIANELAAAERLLAAAEIRFATIQDTLDSCLAFLVDSHRAYMDAPEQIRRRLNQAVFERFLLGSDGSTEAELTEAFRSLLAPDLIASAQTSSDQDSKPLHRSCDWSLGFPAALRSFMKKPRPTLAGLGLNNDHLVPPTGFEPVRRP